MLLWNVNTIKACVFPQNEIFLNWDFQEGESREVKVVPTYHSTAVEIKRLR